MIEIILILHQRMNKLTFLLFLVIFNITYGNIVCPKNSYYKERSYGNNYDKYKLTYYECKKCSPGFVSNTNFTKCTWCPEKNAKINQPIITTLIMYLHMIMDVLNVMQTNMNICRLIIRKLNVKFAKMDIYLIIFVISI